MALSKKDRLRRVVLLCANFVRNLAYYRAGKGHHGLPLLDKRAKHASFWRQVNSDCIDICVLDWCKLFADRQGEHHWRKIVEDATAFKAALLHHVGLTAADFDAYIQTMKTYRDKFVAHLDQEREMNIPDMTVAQTSLWLLHSHLVAREAKPGDLIGLPTADMQLGYDQCFSEAEEIFQSAQ
jgi:hypothetical protein